MESITRQLAQVLQEDLETGEIEQRRSAMRQRPLSATFKEPVVYLYRGVLVSDGRVVRPMDFCTRSERFAREHAQHTATVKGEPAMLLCWSANTKDVFEAPNPGELFYEGPEKRAVIVKTFQPE